MGLLSELAELFQISAAKRHGLGKVVSIAERMSRAFGGSGFAFAISDIGDYTPAESMQPRAGAPHLRLESGGEGLAITPLMRRLAQRGDVTVAQFGQAVGALYFALS